MNVSTLQMSPEEAERSSSSTARTWPEHVYRRGRAARQGLQAGAKGQAASQHQRTPLGRPALTRKASPKLASPGRTGRTCIFRDARRGPRRSSNSRRRCYHSSKQYVDVGSNIYRYSAPAG